MQASETLAELGSAPQARTIRRIRPSRGLVPIDIAELWAYRSLLWLFMWRDIRTRYRQTFLSGFWAIFRPFVTMVMFSIIFNHLAGIDSGTGLPYPLFVYPAVLVWTYFASAAGNGVSAITSNGGLLSKAYFPRLYAPLTVVSAPLVDFLLSFVILLGLFAWYDRAPSWHIVFIPIFLLLAVLFALAISLWLSGASVKYRDIGFGVPFLLQLLLYATPVIYPVSIVPTQYRWLFWLNPMTAVVEGFRWSVLGLGFPSMSALGGALAVTFVLLVPGLFFFRRTERTVVDLI